MTNQQNQITDTTASCYMYSIAKQTIRKEAEVTRRLTSEQVELIHWWITEGYMIRDWVYDLVHIQDLVNQFPRVGALS